MSATIDRAPPAGTLRIVGVRALILLCTFIGAAMACGTGLPPCEPTAALVVSITRPELESASVETEGACTQVTCFREAGAGCVEWRGKMTSTNRQEECVVTLTLPDGRRVGPRTALAGESCGAPAAQSITF